MGIFLLVRGSLFIGMPQTGRMPNKLLDEGKRSCAQGCIAFNDTLRKSKILSGGCASFSPFSIF